MFPSLHIFSFSLSLQGLLLGCGVLAAFATAERLATRLRLPPDRIWTAALLAGVSLFVGERLLLFVQGWRDFLAHPLWMLGLLTVRDERFFYAGAVLAVLVCGAYLLAHRIPLRRAADCLLPALGLMLAFVHAGYFAAGAEPGRVTTAHWGVVSTNRVAHALYGTPLHVPLIPVAAWAAAGYALVTLAAVAAAVRGRSASGLFLLEAGLLTVLLGQFALHWAGEPMVFGVFTWAQSAGILSTVAGAGLLVKS